MPNTEKHLAEVRNVRLGKMQEAFLVVLQHARGTSFSDTLRAVIQRGIDVMQAESVRQPKRRQS